MTKEDYVKAAVQTTFLGACSALLDDTSFQREYAKIFGEEKAKEAPVTELKYRCVEDLMNRYKERYKDFEDMSPLEIYKDIKKHVSEDMIRKVVLLVDERYNVMDTRSVKNKIKMLRDDKLMGFFGFVGGLVSEPILTPYIYSCLKDILFAAGYLNQTTNGLAMLAAIAMPILYGPALTAKAGQMLADKLAKAVSEEKKPLYNEMILRTKNRMAEIEKYMEKQREATY